MDAKVATPPKRPKRTPKSERLPDTPDPVEIAMVAATSGKPIPHVAKRVLEEQAELIHAQRVELRLKHVGDVVRAALWTILAIAALVLVILFGTLLFRAAHSDSLIVESFKVPPAMAQQGLTGDVVATQVLDKIAEFQTKTSSVRAPASYDNNWGDDLKIDIPNTGATAEQVWKLLRGWLGKETRISGEIVDTRDGLALTARVGTSPGQRFTSRDGDLDGLVTKAAEHIMRQTQPYRFVWYLMNSGRTDEQWALLRQLTMDPSPVERKWAWNGISFTHRFDGDFPRALAAAEQALAIDPNMIPGWENAADAHNLMGHDQAALDAANKALSLRNDGEYDQRTLERNACDDRELVGSLLADAAMMDRAADCHGGYSESQTYAVEARAFGDTLRHQVPAVALPNPTNRDEAISNAGITAQAQLLSSLERGDARLASAFKAYTDAVALEEAQKNGGAYVRAQERTGIAAFKIRALLKLGRIDEAAALAATTPLDCYDCVRARGMVAEARGDLPSAQGWYAEAARQAPRLPRAFLDWGRLLARARHFDGAIVKLSHAAALSPNWADPLKYWGDALAAEGKRDQAIAKYDAAMKLAPKWPELQQARARLIA